MIDATRFEYKLQNLSWYLQFQFSCACLGLTFIYEIEKKMSFRRGDVGELFCFKETIELKQRFKFSPNKERTGNLVNISHLMTYTVVQSFSNKKREFIYYLIKKKRQLRSE